MCVTERIFSATTVQPIPEVTGVDAIEVHRELKTDNHTLNCLVGLFFLKLFNLMYNDDKKSSTFLS